MIANFFNFPSSNDLMKRLLKYLALTFALTTVIDAIALSSLPDYPLISKHLLTIRAIIPALGTVLISLAYFGELVERLLHPSFNHEYLIHSILLPLALVGLGSLVTIMMNERISLPSITLSQFRLTKLPSDEFLSAVLTISSLIYGMTVNALFSLVEEIGWRGLMLEETIRFGFLRSSFITGIAWGTWRLPISFAYSKAFPMHSDALGVLTFLLNMLLISVPLAWLRLRSGSLYPVALFSGILWPLSNSFALFLRVEDELFGFPQGIPMLISTSIVTLCLLVMTRKSGKSKNSES